MIIPEGGRYIQVDIGRGAARRPLPKRQFRLKQSAIYFAYIAFDFARNCVEIKKKVIYNERKTTI